MENTFLPYGRQSLDSGDIQAVAEVLKGDFLTTGPFVQRFETALSDYVGAGAAIAVNSGTAGLHIACLAIGLGAGDAAFVPALTFAATSNAVLYCGATPIFVDVDKDTLCMCPQSLIRAIKLAKERGLRPKAVLPVHFAGQPCNLDEIDEVIKDHHMFVLQDACHALGASYLDQHNVLKKVGFTRENEIVVFSFHPVKHITTGEGGAAVTTNLDLAKKMRALRSHGIVREPEEFVFNGQAYDQEGLLNSWYYEMQMLGWNYRMPDILAALGTSQLKKLPDFVEKRRRIAMRYHEAFDELLHITPVNRNATGIHSYHLFQVRIAFDRLKKSREIVMRKLRDVGVGTQVHYLPVYKHPYYQMNKSLWTAAPCPNTENAYETLLSLPIFPGMMDSDIERVIEAIRKLVS